MKIAVAGILVFEGKALLLRRTEPPVCWGPPGGELKDDESFTDGLKREVFEETGLECMFVMPVETWAGMHDDLPMQSITFVCECNDSDVTLSEEHDAFCWVPFDELSEWKDRTDFDVALWGNYIRTAIYHKNLSGMQKRLL